MKKKQHYRDNSRLKIDHIAQTPDKVSLKEKIFVGVVTGLITAVLCVPTLVSLHKTTPPIVPSVADKVSAADDSDAPRIPLEKPPMPIAEKTKVIDKLPAIAPLTGYVPLSKLHDGAGYAQFSDNELYLEDFTYVELDGKRVVSTLKFKHGVPQEQCIPVATKDGYRVMCDGKLLP